MNSRKQACDLAFGGGLLILQKKKKKVMLLFKLIWVNSSFKTTFFLNITTLIMLSYVNYVNQYSSHVKNKLFFLCNKNLHTAVFHTLTVHSVVLQN